MLYMNVQDPVEIPKQTVRVRHIVDTAKVEDFRLLQAHSS